MKVTRITLHVDVDLDGVYGAFNTAESHASELQRMLTQAYSHYRPIVTIEQDSDRLVDTYDDATTS